MKLPTVQFDAIMMKGGLDLMTPTLSLIPGALRDCLNYEVAVQGGYTRVAGYERLDGRTAPSSAAYIALSVSFSSTPSLWATVTGGTSGATGKVAQTGLGVLVLTAVSGTFQNGETLSVGGSPIATVIDAATVTSKENAQYLAYAADYYRSLIQVVPGSGPVRGAVKHSGAVYAFRDDAGGTQTLMYKATTGGWSAVPLGYELSFSAGVSQINDGDTVTGGTSGATGVVSRTVLQSGAWGSTAAGRLILSSTTGTFQNGETIRVGATNKATCGGAAAAITLQPGGRFEFDRANLAGGANAIRLYGCDGVNRGFEFDGTVFVPIVTGMTLDAPKHLKVHRNYLFFSFGASLQFSSLGLPYQWQVVTGAGEMATGDEITGLTIQPGSSTTAAMVVYTQNNTFILYGTSSSTWSLVPFNKGVGGIHYTAQTLAGGYVFDQRGVMSLQPTLNYGNFDSAALTYNIRPVVTQKRDKVVGSSVSLEKSQYRLFFNDGYALYATIVNDQYKGAGLIWYPHNMYNAWCGEDDDGMEITLLCGDGGYVYQLDVGASFDGESIPATFTSNCSTAKGPRILKRYRKAAIEIQADIYAEIDFSYTLGYGSASIDQAPTVNYALPFDAQVYWDLFTWDMFSWDGQAIGPTECELDGTAENIAITIASNANYIPPYTINSALIHYTSRRAMR